uniref:DUF6589 domain-containing protein n=1 Tax=Amphimedon queenslandica TaxID=400682 RepID=A0A1X7THQ5_AMPQE
MATRKTVICYCCGSNITAQANNRYSMFSKSFNDLLSIWRELFEELPVEETSDDILYSSEIVPGRICRPCAASLQKIAKLKSVKKEMKKEMKNALSVIKSYKQGGMISETEVENQLTSTCTPTSSQSSLPMKRTLENLKTNSPRKKARESKTISPKVLLQVEREKTVHSIVSHTCLLQKIVGLILYSSHCSKDAFQRLCSIGLSVTYTTVNRTVNFISKDHDVEVKKWRDDIVSVLLKEDHAFSAADNGILFGPDNEDSLSLRSSDSSVDDECEDCNSDTSCDPLPLSPVTSSASDDDDSSTEQFQVSLSDVQQEVVTEKDNEQCIADSEPLCTSFKIVGDNVDKNVTPRYMRSDIRTKSLHYYHSFAVKSRINVDDLPSQKPDSCLPSPTYIAKSLLPSVNDDDCLIANLKILFSRILLQTLPAFEVNFSDLVCRHIVHRRYKEMSSKSTVVPLGVLPKNENKTKEMKEILEHLHQYVPKVVSTRQYQVPGNDNSKEVTVIDEKVHHILLGGDQLSQARARGALKSKANSQTPSTKLNGFIPTVEDWHTKLTLFEVIWKYFVRKESSGDHGTAYQLRNVLGRCNVVTSPKKDLNACEDFLMLIIWSYVTLAAMEVLGMKEVDDIPSSLPSEFWLEDKEKRNDAMD